MIKFYNHVVGLVFKVISYISNHGNVDSNGVSNYGYLSHVITLYLPLRSVQHVQILHVCHVTFGRLCLLAGLLSPVLSGLHKSSDHL